eukprot:SAG31_NODE_1037_length_10221_cov_4.564019_9_plen_127_part_00
MFRPYFGRKLCPITKFHEERQRTSDNPLSYAWKQTEMRSIGGPGSLAGGTTRQTRTHTRTHAHGPLCCVRFSYHSHDLGHSGPEFGRKHCDLTFLAEHQRRAPMPYGGQNSALSGYPGLPGDCMRY